VLFRSSVTTAAVRVTILAKYNDDHLLILRPGFDALVLLRSYAGAFDKVRPAARGRFTNYLMHPTIREIFQYLIQGVQFILRKT
jgi:hypothetical protein